jgi:hypothetical protein
MKGIGKNKDGVLMFVNLDFKRKLEIEAKIQNFPTTIEYTRFLAKKEQKNPDEKIKPKNLKLNRGGFLNEFSF